MPGKPTLVWFRNDLRLADNPALHAASLQDSPVLPVFIWDGGRPNLPGSASRWWLYHSLKHLAESLAAKGSSLVVQSGETLEALCRLAEQTGASRLYFNRGYEPEDRLLESRIKERLAGRLEVKSFKGNLLFEPWALANKQGKPYQVFTPFWKQCLTLLRQETPLPAPDGLAAPPAWPECLPLEVLGLAPKLKWAEGFHTMWTPGEAGAAAKLAQFVQSALWSYAHNRDIPNLPGTSELSPHLHYGEISIRQVVAAVQQALAEQPHRSREDADIYLKELGWREFAYHLLHYFPHTVNAPLKEAYRAFPWRHDPEGLKAWQRGQTGYPIVDAGMRQLWRLGWMHNRVRMIAGSFLVKDLLLPWQDGAAWFWDTLVDADVANNALGWQWVAGSGADASPFFRIFNPVLQGEKFDPQGGYIRRWVPELAELPDKWIHQPWKASSAVLQQAGIILGRNYPFPIVDHDEARQSALNAYAKIRS